MDKNSDLSKKPLLISPSTKLLFADYNNAGAYQNMALTCFNAHDRSICWRQALGSTYGRFTIQEKKLYMMGWSKSHEDNMSRYNVFALQGDTGAKLWSAPLELLPLIGVIDQPVVADGRVYMSFGRRPVHADVTEICAFSQIDGKHLWQIQVPSGRITHAGNGLVFMSSQDASISAFQATNGEPVWRTKVPLSEFLPLLQNDTLYACEEEMRECNIVALRASDGKMCWRNHYQNSYVTSFSVGSMHVYLSMRDRDGQLPPSFYALDLHTGDLDWQLSAVEVTREGVVEYDEVVYVPTSNNGLLALSAHTGQRNWQYKKRFSQSQTFGLPVIADGKIFFKLDAWLSLQPFKGIVCLDVSHGSPHWYYQINDLDMERSIGIIQG